MQANKPPSQQYEHLLFGSVTDAELNPLLHRLRGLCDYATAGGVPFTDREIGYKIGIECCNDVASIKGQLIMA